MNTCILTALAVASLAMQARAQTSINADHAFSWGENVGWLNWREAGLPAGSAGVRVHPSFLSGYVWGENVGWISMGDGTPTTGRSYANLTGLDFGVNRETASGELSGLAWGENIGWINFSMGSLPTSQRPRLDRVARRFRGFAYGENIGWINLDDATHYVAVEGECRADWNLDGEANSQDFFDFLAAFFSFEPAADLNDNTFINSQDFFDFLAAFFQGC